MVPLALLLLLIALGVAAALGKTADSRDPAYGLGALLAPRGQAEAPAQTGNLRVDAGPRSSADRAAAF